MNKPIPLILDTFTDTDATSLAAHAGDSANTWVASTGNIGPSLNLIGNQLSITTLNGGYSTGDPALTDITTMIENSPQATNPIGVGPVLNASANMPGGSYVGIYYSAQWHLFRGSSTGFTALAATNIGTEFPTAGAPADQYTIRLIRRTSNGIATIGMIINGRQVLSATDASPLTGRPGIYSNNTGTGTVDHFKVFPPSSEVGVAMIGDSITFGSFIVTQPDVFFGAILSKGKTGLPVVIYNHGVSGTTTTDWANATNGASLASVIADLQSQNRRLASVMLGVNDCKTTSRISIATHKANIASICRTLNAAGIAVMLNRPTYVVPGSFSSAWDSAASTTYLPGYWDAQQSLINNTTIFEGDVQGFDMIAADPTNRTGDGVHPVQNFSRILFQMHADAAISLFSSPVPPGTSYSNRNVDGRLI